MSTTTSTPGILLALRPTKEMTPNPARPREVREAPVRDQFSSYNKQCCAPSRGMLMHEPPDGTEWTLMCPVFQGPFRRACPHDQSKSDASGARGARGENLLGRGDGINVASCSPVT